MKCSLSLSLSLSFHRVEEDLLLSTFGCPYHLAASRKRHSNSLHYSINEAMEKTIAKNKGLGTMDLEQFVLARMQEKKMNKSYDMVHP